MGEDPDLTNMTFSMTVVKKGDVVFLTSDGVSDNFDPVIAGKAQASPEFNDNVGMSYTPVHTSDGQENTKPVFSPIERQEQSEIQLEEILKETEIPNENINSAHGICAKLLNYTSELTQKKREAQQSANTVILERAKNPDQNNYEHPDNTVDGLRQFVRSLPGKLDHASTVAYVVGMHGIEEEEEQGEMENGDVAESTNLQEDAQDGLGSKEAEKLVQDLGSESTNIQEMLEMA